MTLGPGGGCSNTIGATPAAIEEIVGLMGELETGRNPEDAATRLALYLLFIWSIRERRKFMRFNLKLC